MQPTRYAAKAHRLCRAAGMSAAATANVIRFAVPLAKLRKVAEHPAIAGRAIPRSTPPIAAERRPAAPARSTPSVSRRLDAKHHDREDHDMLEHAPHGQSYERQIHDLCRLAGCPEKASEHIYAHRSVASVREALAGAATMHTGGVASSGDLKGWGKAIRKAGAATSRKPAGGGWDRVIAKVTGGVS